MEWVLKPADVVRPMMGRTRARPYRRDPSRASRLSGAADVFPDLGTLGELLPELGSDKIADLALALPEEATVDSFSGQGPTSLPTEGLE